MTINRRNFFDRVRQSLFGGRLKQAQVDGLQMILHRWDTHHARDDDRWLAYMLATVHHETDRTFRPIREYGRGKGREYGVACGPDGQIYYGRGFVQLTWMYNYKAMSAFAGCDLVQEPDRALEPEISTIILFEGMMRGTFTGRKLADYFSGEKENWVQARRIINGMDKANLIADHARHYYDAISYTTG